VTRSCVSIRKSSSLKELVGYAQSEAAHLGAAQRRKIQGRLSALLALDIFQRTEAAAKRAKRWSFPKLESFGQLA